MQTLLGVRFAERSPRRAQTKRGGGAIKAGIVLKNSTEMDLSSTFYAAVIEKTRGK
jgi:hypothetical protein